MNPPEEAYPGTSVEWYNGGTFTQIGSTYATAPVNGQLARIEANGSTFTGFVAGTQRISGSNASAPSSGYGGLSVNNVNARLDNFEVGNLAAGEPPLRVVLGEATIGSRSF